MGETAEDDFFVNCSDEELYNPGKEVPIVWQPTPDVIKELYWKISRGEKLELQWHCPGRRVLQPAEEEDSLKEEEPAPLPEADTSMEERKERTTAMVNDFEFDDLDQLNNPIFSKRTPAQNKNTPKPKRDVAQMDKILNEFKKTKMSPSRKQSTPIRSPVARPLGANRTPGTGTPRSAITNRNQLIEALAAKPLTSRSTVSTAPINRTPTAAAANKSPAPVVRDTSTPASAETTKSEFDFN